MLGLFVILLLGTVLVWFSVIFCRDAQQQANLVSTQEAARPDRGPAPDGQVIPDHEPAPEFAATTWSDLDDRQLARFLDESGF